MIGDFRFERNFIMSETQMVGTAHPTTPFTRRSLLTVN